MIDTISSEIFFTWWRRENPLITVPRVSIIPQPAFFHIAYFFRPAIIIKIDPNETKYGTVYTKTYKRIKKMHSTLMTAVQLT